MIPLIMSALYIFVSSVASAAIMNWLGHPLGIIYGVIGAFVAAFIIGQDEDDMLVTVTRFVMVMVAWPVCATAFVLEVYKGRSIKFRIKVR